MLPAGSWEQEGKTAVLTDTEVQDRKAKELLKVREWHEEFLVLNTREDKSELEHRWDNKKCLGRR